MFKSCHEYYFFKLIHFSKQKHLLLSDTPQLPAAASEGTGFPVGLPGNFFHPFVII